MIMSLIDSVFHLHQICFLCRNIISSLVGFNYNNIESVWLCGFRLMTADIITSKEAADSSNKYIIRNPKIAAGDPKQDVFAISSILLELAVGSPKFDKHVKSGR